MFDRLIELFKKIGLKLEKDQEDQLKTEIQKIETVKPDEPAKPPAEKPTGGQGGDDTTIQALTKEVADLKSLIGAMKQDRDNTIAAQKEKMEADRKKKVEELKTKGIKEGRITESNWESKWKAIAEKDPDQFDTILSDLAVDPKLVKNDKNNSSGGEQNQEPKYVGPLLGADSKMVDAMSKMDSN